MKTILFLIVSLIIEGNIFAQSDSSSNLILKAISYNTVSLQNLKDCPTEVKLNYSSVKSDTSITIAPKATVTILLPINGCATVKAKPVKSCAGGGNTSSWLSVLMPCVLAIRDNRVNRPPSITEPTKFQVYSMMGVHITDVVISDFKQVKQALNSLPISTYILKSDDNVIKYFNR